jgi:hypothetical protein
MDIPESHGRSSMTLFEFFSRIEQLKFIDINKFFIIMCKLFILMSCLMLERN